MLQLSPTKACINIQSSHFFIISTSHIFQKLMDTILQGIPGVTCYIDDILISANDEQSHLQSLEYVFHAWKSMVFDSNKKM